MTETLEFKILIFHLKVWIILYALQNAIPLFWTIKLQPRNCVFSSLLIVLFQQKKKKIEWNQSNKCYVLVKKYICLLDETRNHFVFVFFPSRFMMSNEGKTEHVAVLYIFSECIANGSENIWYSYMFEAFARVRSDMYFGFYPNWRRFKSFIILFTCYYLQNRSLLLVNSRNCKVFIWVSVCVCGSIKETTTIDHMNGLWILIKLKLRFSTWNAAYASKCYQISNVVHLVNVRQTFKTTNELRTKSSVHHHQKYIYISIMNWWYRFLLNTFCYKDIQTRKKTKSNWEQHRNLSVYV